MVLTGAPVEEYVLYELYLHFHYHVYATRACGLLNTSLKLGRPDLMVSPGSKKGRGRAYRVKREA